MNVFECCKTNIASLTLTRDNLVLFDCFLFKLRVVQNGKESLQNGTLKISRKLYKTMVKTCPYTPDLYLEVNEEVLEDINVHYSEAGYVLINFFVPLTVDKIDLEVS